ncbi:helicase associated domain-containing protein [Arthrobacter sp. SO3]|uniref:helicase associated domain-containing protein n=1 Tax=Arthrobacter sp. SO3 TaxID=1897057 RepID=UPI001D001877|nr:helicase associated domain-containing protein [Arthrobacter sp. SO3]
MRVRQSIQTGSSPDDRGAGAGLGGHDRQRREGKPRVEADDARWHERLAKLKAYRAAGNDWPRHQAIITGEEHVLGIWLHSQRFKLRRGELDSERAAALTASVPGWQAGRKRGRRPTDRA